MQERKRNSFGEFIHKKGTKLEVNAEKYILDQSREFYLFDVIPMGAVRMTVSDKWKTNSNHLDPKKRQRRVVQKYFAFKNILTMQANLMQYKLGKTFEAVFFLPMPDTWSQKKKDKMNGMPHEQKPDVDNLIKGILDCLKKEGDQDVWHCVAEKRWEYKGSIIILA